jgi:hypothetical protein
MRPLLFPDDQQFWYETLRALGHTAYGGADIGEVVTTAARITAGNYDSWYEQWAATAERTEAEAGLRGQRPLLRRRRRADVASGDAGHHPVRGHGPERLPLPEAARRPAGHVHHVRRL